MLSSEGKALLSLNLSTAGCYKSQNKVWSRRWKLGHKSCPVDPELVSWECNQDIHTRFCAQKAPDLENSYSVKFLWMLYLNLYFVRDIIWVSGACTGIGVSAHTGSHSPQSPHVAAWLEAAHSLPSRALSTIRLYAPALFQIKTPATFCLGWWLDCIGGWIREDSVLSLPSVPVDVGCGMWWWAQTAVHMPWGGGQGSCYSIPGAMDWTFGRRLCEVSWAPSVLTRFSSFCIWWRVIF